MQAGHVDSVHLETAQVVLDVAVLRLPKIHSCCRIIHPVVIILIDKIKREISEL